MKGFARLVLAITLLAIFGLCPTSSAQTFPQVVASVSLTDQNLPIRNTVLYTPSADGIFRITVYENLTTRVERSAVMWNFYVQWFDDAGQGERSFSTLPVDAKPPNATASFTTTFHAAASQPIIYFVTEGLRASAYSLYITVEQLQ